MPLVRSFIPHHLQHTIQRGVVSLVISQLYIRNPQKNANLVSFVPPSINAGCGGMNIFGGSASRLSMRTSSLKTSRLSVQTL
ncbi:conjugal transfer protein TraH [Photobacterium leiognathi]|uniref:conjugal transfer protein TraH n=1 Tax=Photobacterium leiognathi TaxID=553611 RepID=UPI0034E93F96